MDTSIPFFVYGTLIPGQPNDYYWGKSILKTAVATYPHGRLVSLHAFPMLLEDQDTPESEIHGMLVYINSTDYSQVTEFVDQLEEYDPENPNSPYQRVLREVFTADGEKITAWIYVGSQEIGQAYPTISGGDWVAYLTQSGSDGMAQWWQEKGESLLFGRATAVPNSKEKSE